MNIRCYFLCLLIVCAGICSGGPTLGQATDGAKLVESQTTATESRPTPAKMSDVAWIAGNWQGNAMGGKFEETWNPPFGGAMMGMFKFVKDDEIAFYELLTIVEENDSLLLRLKHFDKGLVGWEEKDKSVEFPLKSLTATEAIFDGLKFQKIGNDEMLIVVKTKKGNEINELKFECRRVKAEKQSSAIK